MKRRPFPAAHDRPPNSTTAAAADHSRHIEWQNSAITKAARAAIKSQSARCLWLTGLSGAGKTTIANLLDEALYQRGYHSFVLDGDRCRDGLCRDLDFSLAGRMENVRRVSEVARLMVDAGLIVIVSLISPLASQREMARKLFEKGEFLEVFVNTPLEVCEARDPKGLYRKARDGLIPEFTGISSAYEPPANAEIVLDGEAPPTDLVQKMLMALNAR
jgi:adenylyl-sulfate kinase